jgi:hypothetical protein
VPGGRPKKKIDEDILFKLFQLQSPLDEIADYFGVNRTTIQNYCKNELGHNFSTLYKQGSAEGKTALRGHQFQLSKKNAGMAIFLGKNYLGQKDGDRNDFANAEDVYISIENDDGSKAVIPNGDSHK